MSFSLSLRETLNSCSFFFWCVRELFHSLTVRNGDEKGKKNHLSEEKLELRIKSTQSILFFDSHKNTTNELEASWCVCSEVQLSLFSLTNLALLRIFLSIVEFEFLHFHFIQCMKGIKKGFLNFKYTRYIATRWTRCDIKIWFNPCTVVIIILFSTIINNRN